MVSPQAENGHTDIAHELLIALMQTDLSNNEFRVVLTVIRKTYGWHKKEDGISLSHFEAYTFIKPQHLIRILTRLEQRQMVIIYKKGRGKMTCYKFQKDYSQWLDKRLLPITIILPEWERQLLPKQVIPKLATTITQTGNSLLPKQVNTKETNTKETIQKKENTPTTPDNNKRSYGEFNNVFLTLTEYDRLIERFGEAGVKDRIRELSLGIGSKGYKYKSHYATILNWDRRYAKEHPEQRQSRW